MALEKFIGPQKAYLKSSEIAKIFNVDHSTVFLWVKKRKLHPIRTPGGNFRFTRAEVEKLFRETTAKFAERRRSQRFEVHFPVKVQVASGERVLVYTGFIRDVSSQGLGLVVRNGRESLSPFLDGQVRSVLVQNTGAFPLKEAIKGEVRHTHPIDEQSVSVGVLLA